MKRVICILLAVIFIPIVGCSRQSKYDVSDNAEQSSQLGGSLDTASISNMQESVKYNADKSAAEMRISKLTYVIKITESNVYSVSMDIELKGAGSSFQWPVGIYKNNESKGVLYDLDVKGAEYTLSQDDGYSYLLIKKPEKKIKINFSYSFPKIDFPNGDRTEFNMLSDKFGLDIDEFFFSISMPLAFNPSNTGFRLSPDKGSFSVEYEVNGEIISGRADKTVPKGHNIQFYALLPEGYFTGSLSSSLKTLNSYLNN